MPAEARIHASWYPPPSPHAIPAACRRPLAIPRFETLGGRDDMKPARRVFVLGGAHSGFIGKFHPDFIWKGHPDFGKRANPTLEEHIERAVIGALEKTGVPAAAVQKGYIGNFTGELFSKQGHL